MLYTMKLGCDKSSYTGTKNYLCVYIICVYIISVYIINSLYNEMYHAYGCEMYFLDFS